MKSRALFALTVSPLLLAIACGDDLSGSGDSGLDGDGNPIGGGDGATLGDGSFTDGNPLEVPLSEFCSGRGSVVIVGGGDICAGEIAQDTFQFGLCACETIRVGSNLSLDAFDSSRGTYGAALAGGGTNVLHDGNLGINGTLTAEGKVDLLGSAFVSGGGFSAGPQSRVTRNLYANGDAVQANSSSSVGRNMYVNGDVTGAFTITGDLYVPEGASVANQTSYAQLVRGPIPPVVPCPCAENQILDIAALTNWARTHNDNAVRNVITATAWENGGPSNITLPCGRYYITRINQGSGGLTIRAEGRTVLYVDGDLQVAGQMNLEIAPGAEIDLFVAGDLGVGASLRFGDATQPSAVRTYSAGTGTLALAASSVFGGNLYAPRAHVDFGAAATIYGALFARSVQFQGSADVHFDSAVRRAGEACEPPPTPDAGVPDVGAPDGGAPDLGPPDAGPVECVDGCGCGGGLGCVEDVCAPCASDLDCCAPSVCGANGQCLIAF